MTPLHAEHATVVAISNRLYERDEAAWRALLAVAHRLDVTLLALIYNRLREVRDDVAREAFERQLSIGEVARERLSAGVRNSISAPRRARHAVSEFIGLQLIEDKSGTAVAKVDSQP